MRIEPLAADRLAAVAALEAACFSTPWTPGQLAGELGAPGALSLCLLEGERLLGYALLRRRIRRTDAAVGATWGCGYAQPTPRMQYTGSSFGDVLVGLFGWVLRPRTSRPALKKLFPDRVEFACEVQDTVLHGLVLPVFRRAAAAMMKLRRLQQGRLDLYLLYLLVILIVLLSWGRHLGL